jgi:hypothetical protein
VKKLSSLLMCVGVVLIAYSGWQVYQAGIDPQTLVEIEWPTPATATVGEETAAPILLTNRSWSTARVVGLNHC